MTKRTSALASAIEEKLPNKVDNVTDNGGEVYVMSAADFGRTMTGVDDVCTVAYDHGFVPVGIVDSGALRLVPRNDDEVSV